MIRAYTKLIVALAGSLALAGTVALADDNWQLSLGISYRQVGDLDLSSVAFSNSGYNGSAFVTGFLVSELGGVFSNLTDPAIQLDSADPLNPVGGDTLALHKITFAGGSEDMDDAPGLELNARRSIFATGETPWNLNLSMVWFGADLSTSMEVSGVTYTGTLILPIIVGPMNPDPTTTLPGVIGILDFDFDLDAWTFGAGIGPEFALSNGSISLEIGPSITIVDYNASCEQSAFWDNGAGQIAGVDSKESDDGVDFLFGLYIAASYAYDFTEQAGVELGARYDFIEDLDTDVATMEMSGFSLTGRLFYRF